MTSVSFANIAVTIFFGLLLITAALYGTVRIARTNFLGVASASLVLGAVISLVFSGVAGVMLVLLDQLSSSAPIFVFAKAATAALARPTLSGIVLLALLLVLAMGASQLVAIMEEIHILLQCHKAFGSRHKKDPVPKKGAL